MMWRWQAAQFIEIRWWRRYLSGRSPEQYLSWKRQYWTYFLDKCAFYPAEGTRVLDAGCGPAGIFTILRKNEVWAFDPLLDRYDAQLEHFKKADYPWVRFENQTLESLDLKDFFDVVFCLNAVNHVAKWDGAMTALVQSLKPGGILILSIDVHRYGFLKNLFRLLPGDVLHPQQHDLNDYASWLSASGLVMLRMFPLKKERIFEYWVLVVTRPVD